MSEQRLRRIVKEAVREAYAEGVVEEQRSRRSGWSVGRLLVVAATVGTVAYLMRTREGSITEMVSEAPDQVQRAAGETAARTEETAEEVGERVRAGGQKVSEQTAERIEESGETVGDRIEEGGTEAADRMEETFDEDDET